MIVKRSRDTTSQALNQKNSYKKQAPSYLLPQPNPMLNSSFLVPANQNPGLNINISNGGVFD